MSSNYLLYDGECPACRSYIAIAQLKRSHPDLRILDARREPALVAELRQRGYEINDGMVVNLDGRIYYGANATRLIAELGRNNGALRRAALHAVGGTRWSGWLYPKLNGMRQLLLKGLGRKLID